MNIVRGAALMAALLPLLVTPAGAHSIEELESQLLGRDKYFQPMDQPAPAFSLIDSADREVDLADYRGKVVILNFIYASCGDVCPLHSQLIAQLQSMINISPMKGRVAFISITTDPSHDRGRLLTEYGEAQGLDLVNWTFLTSPADQPEDTTRKVAKAYGLEFTEVDAMQMHGLVTHVVDREGKLRGRFHGLNFEALSLVTFANALANDTYAQGHSEPDQDPWSWITNLFGGQ
ncbi:MAG: SCO family protein [Kaiparowitsia implicata GSE-PSE-MK54-09C]|jgi:protein SCO1/2|nr:SCO family protein [Kaiparowitsia implicata GSE-PSE-MK54-09C]